MLVMVRSFSVPQRLYAKSLVNNLWCQPNIEQKSEMLMEVLGGGLKALKGIRNPQENLQSTNLDPWELTETEPTNKENTPAGPRPPAHTWQMCSSVSVWSSQLLGWSLSLS